MVSKYRSMEELEEVYACGHRDLAENRVQELLDKQEQLPKDVRWHMIGHLQRNKVKFIAPFVHLIHAVDTARLLNAIDKEAAKHQRIIPFLFQVHIAEEEHKYGWDPKELEVYLQSPEYKALKNVQCKGLMGMATLTQDRDQIRLEFARLRSIFSQMKQSGWDSLSMGMSGDYAIAVEEGSTMIRVGSKVFAD